jgi:carboxyl-terminal processing protease
MSIDPDRVPAATPVGRAAPDLRRGGDGPAASRVLAVLLVLAIAFGAGLALGRADGPRQGGFGSVSPTPARSLTGVVPTPSPAAPTASPGGASPGSGSFAPSGSPAPTPSDDASGTPPAAEPTPTPRRTPGPTVGPGATVPPFAPANIGLLWEAIKLTQEQFVRRSQIDPNDLTYGAIDGLMRALGDPGHTVFLTPDEVKSENDSLRGTIIGIGVFLGIEAGTPIIVSVVDRSPADRAGLQSGDRIIAIDGEDAAALTQEAISTLIRGPENSVVRLTVVHPGTNVPVDVSVRRQRIEIPAVTWAMLPGTRIADLRIVQFSADCGEEFSQALRAARQSGATGIVIDLRNNPGGYVGEAVEVASTLLRSGTVFIRRTASGEQIAVQVRRDAIAPDLPVVALIDYGSASSSEILAGALQDNDRARLVGIRTYGTGTVLNTFGLPDGSALRLAVEEWLTPKGRFIFPSGIAPDERVGLDPLVQPLEPGQIRDMSASELRASGDEQLLRALAILNGG